MRGMFRDLVRLQPAGAVVVVCETLTTLNPCDFGSVPLSTLWSEDVHWVWLRSPVLCPSMKNGTGQPLDVIANVDRRCPAVLDISLLEMGGIHPHGELAEPVRSSLEPAKGAQVTRRFPCRPR